MFMRVLNMISIESTLTGVNLPSTSAGGLLAAERVKIRSGYSIDGYQVDSLFKYYFDSWAYTQNVNSALYSLMDICFRLGYLKGGRAAMKGKFKEPPRRRKKK